MTEQNTTPTETDASIVAIPAESNLKRAKRETKTSRASSFVKSRKKKASRPLTDEQKRLRKNEALRAWRQAHKEEYSLYLRNWKAKRAKQQERAARAAKKGKTS